MKVCFLVLIFGCFIILSCQKEINFELKGDNIPIDTTWRMLLLKMVSKSAGKPDSVVINFKYDNLKRLIEYDVSGSSQNFPSENYKIIRNVQRNISRIRSTVSDPSLSGIETTSYTLFYDVTATHILYRLGDIRTASGNFRDSTIYQYDASDKITQERVFRNLPGTVSFFEATRRNFVYDNLNNLIEATSYTDFSGSGNLQLDAVSTFSYDTKLNPLHFKNESIVIGRHLVGVPSENNVTREIIQFPQDPSMNVIRDHVYSYNASDYPISDIITVSGDKQQISYYYQ